MGKGGYFGGSTIFGRGTGKIVKKARTGGNPVGGVTAEMERRRIIRAKAKQADAARTKKSQKLMGVLSQEWKLAKGQAHFEALQAKKIKAQLEASDKPLAIALRKAMKDQEQE